MFVTVWKHATKDKMLDKNNRDLQSFPSSIENATRSTDVSPYLTLTSYLKPPLLWL